MDYGILLHKEISVHKETFTFRMYFSTSCTMEGICEVQHSNLNVIGFVCGRSRMLNKLYALKLQREDGTNAFFGNC